MICNSYLPTEKITLSLLHITSLVNCYTSLVKIVINSHNHPILVFIFYIQWWWSFRNLQNKQNSSIPAVTMTGLEGWEVIRGTRVVDRKLTPYRVSRTFSENLKTHASVKASVSVWFYKRMGTVLNIFLPWVLYGWRCLIIENF